MQTKRSLYSSSWPTIHPKLLAQPLPANLWLCQHLVLEFSPYFVDLLEHLIYADSLPFTFKILPQLPSQAWRQARNCCLSLPRRKCFQSLDDVLARNARVENALLQVGDIDWRGALDFRRAWWRRLSAIFSFLLLLLPLGFPFRVKLPVNFVGHRPVDKFLHEPIKAHNFGTISSSHGWAVPTRKVMIHGIFPIGYGRPCDDRASLFFLGFHSISFCND